MLVAKSSTVSSTLSIAERVFYANLIVVIATVALFSVIYVLSFNNPSVEEYKEFAREGVKIYGGVIPLLSLMLYNQFKKLDSKKEKETKDE